MKNYLSYIIIYPDEYIFLTLKTISRERKRKERFEKFNNLHKIIDK